MSKPEHLLRKQAHWRLKLLVVVSTALVVSIPQIFVIAKRGSNWNGSYAILDFDELTYSAYVNGLIIGQPRQFNPFQKRDKKPVSESYFSLQFLPAYAVALPSRLLGISASAAFVILLPLMTIFSALVLLLVLIDVTGDTKLSAVGVLLVLFCGRLVSESPFVPDQLYASFSFVRRPIPAVAFPFFFVFMLGAWRALRGDLRTCLLWSVPTGVSLVVLIFSYFYLWTAAAAWLLCFSATWFVLRKEERRQVGLHLIIVILIGLCGLIPYFILLSRRANTIDTAQALVSTHTPDLFRISEVVGFATLCALVYFFRRGRLTLTSPTTIFCISCLTLPLVVFNQQIITGRSLQPFHYEQFIVNYVLLAGLVITYHLVWRKLKVRLLLWGIFALGVGVVTGFKEARDNLNLNLRRDQAEPVFQRLDYLAAADKCSGFALFNNTLLAASAPTSSSVPPLWAPNLYTHGTISSQEDLERLFQSLFYLGVGAEQFHGELESNLQLRAAVFGLPRVNRKLSVNPQPITNDEIMAQVTAYGSYTNAFGGRNADQWPLCYLVMIDEVPYDLSHIDLWYWRVEADRVGGSIIYRLQRRVSAAY